MKADDATPEELWQRRAEESPHTSDRRARLLQARGREKPLARQHRDRPHFAPRDGSRAAREMAEG
jgi:hypothetical protein